MAYSLFEKWPTGILYVHDSAVVFVVLGVSFLRYSIEIYAVGIENLFRNCMYA